MASHNEQLMNTIFLFCSSRSAGVDYVDINVTVDFLLGETTREVCVSIAEDDIFPEPNKTFEVYLAAFPWSVPLSTLVTILNDDPDLPGMSKCVCVYVCLI